MTDWDKVARQTQGYRELDEFKPGDSLHLQYFPVPSDILEKHQKEKDKKAMEEYEQKLREKEESQKALLELREEEPRENGHNKPTIKVNFKKAFETLGITDICKGCDKHTVFCTCNKEDKNNPSHCDLKKKSKRKKKQE